MQGGVSVVTLSSAEEAQFGFRLELPSFTADIIFIYHAAISRVGIFHFMRSWDEKPTIAFEYHLSSAHGREYSIKALYGTSYSLMLVHISIRNKVL